MIWSAPEALVIRLVNIASGSSSAPSSAPIVSVSSRNSSMVMLALVCSSSGSVTLESSSIVVVESLISIVMSGVSELFSQASDLLKMDWSPMSADFLFAS